MKKIFNEIKNFKIKSSFNFFKFATYRKVLDEVNKQMDDCYKQERFVSICLFRQKEI